MTCPFCRCDPFHYVDIGVGYEAVAVNCCELGMSLYSREKQHSQFAGRVLRQMRSHSPRQKAKAWRHMIAAGVREPGRKLKARKWAEGRP